MKKCRAIEHTSPFFLITVNAFNWKMPVCQRPPPYCLDRDGRDRPLLPAAPALPRSRRPPRIPRPSVPGIPRVPRSRRSSRPSPSASRAPPARRPLPRPWPQRLVPPARPRYWAARRCRERPARPIGGLRSPLGVTPNTGRPRAGIGRAPPRSALRSPARQAGPADRGEPGWPFWMAATAGP